MTGPQDLRVFLERLRRDLRSALKLHQAERVSALRAMIAAVDNAGAAHPANGAMRPDGGVIAHSTPGLFSTEAPRRELSMTDVHAIIRGLVGDWETQATHYRSLQQHDAADRLVREAEILRAYL